MRREGDSNPRYPHGHAGFQDRWLANGTDVSGLMLREQAGDSGTIPGPNCGELVTTNENAERVVASSERGQEHAAELARIIAVCSELPAVLKGAMLAIVDSAGAARSRPGKP